jgi:hypothetical protein
MSERDSSVSNKIPAVDVENQSPGGGPTLPNKQAPHVSWL